MLNKDGDDHRSHKTFREASNRDLDNETSNDTRSIRKTSADEQRSVSYLNGPFLRCGGDRAKRGTDEETTGI